MGLILKKSIKIAIVILFIAYLCYLCYLTFFAHLYGRGITHRNYNFVPLKTILQYLGSRYNQNIIVINILGNIAAFIPMGFLPTLVFKRLDSFLKVMLVVLISSAAIEAVQYITAVGAADIDDLILNMAGGAAGCLLAMLARNLCAWLGRGLGYVFK